MLAVLLVVAGSMSSASRRLTSFSLGSCDAADYAAGARVFREFASGDRDGFMGLTEVVRILSVDNFYDYWVRLNHFTPSAIAALNAITALLNTAHMDTPFEYDVPVSPPPLVPIAS